jgi:hypothetical protein
MKTGTKKTGRNDLKTLAAVAKELGASPAALRKAVQGAGIVPDVVRCGCAYYGVKTQAALRRLAKG